ncbi:MAG: hypothetical protein EPN40_02895 [Rhodanobacteraceae bacterium]|nr:MAG: hypothetical protein EPN40_02895 [Rhodanobacteraceae bacterium]
MRRWNGWGDDSIRLALPETALALLEKRVGTPLPFADTPLETVMAAVPSGRLTKHPLIDASPQTRVRDFKRLTWAAENDWKWAALPIERRMLPQLAAPATIIGEVTPQAARECGISAGTPLVAAAADKACEVLGSGCTQTGTACLTMPSIAASIAGCMGAYARSMNPFARSRATPR